jgi:hypothetical protein
VNLGLHGDAFRVVTPFASQAAAFEKNSCAYSRAVFRGHPLDFKDSCLWSKIHRG